MKNIKDKKIVVTGADGFIGANMVVGLREAGYENILAVDVGDAPKHNAEVLEGCAYQDCKNFLSDVKRGALEDVGAIVHLGACSDTTERNEEYIKQNNIEYSKRLYEYCEKNDCQFVYASSAATYGDGSRGFDDKNRDLEPMNLYGLSKHLFDEWVRDNKVRPPQ